MTDSIESVLARLEDQPRFHQDVRLVLDAQAFADAQALNHRLEQAIRGNIASDEDVTVEGPEEIAKQIAAMEDEHPPVLFRFEALDPDIYYQIITEHDAPKERHPHLMAASCIVFADQELDEQANVDTFLRLRKALTPAQWALLAEVARTVNESLFDLRPTGAASAILKRMRHSSDSATDD